MSEQTTQQPVNQQNWNMPTYPMMGNMLPMGPFMWGNPWMMGGGPNSNNQRPSNNGQNPWFGTPQNGQNNQAQPISQPEVTNQPQEAQPQQPVKVTVPCVVISDDQDIKPADVPMDGGFSMFMKKDLSSIYLKQWQNDGKIYTKTFVESVEQEPSETSENGQLPKEFLDGLNKRFEQLELAVYNLAQSMGTGNAKKSDSTKKTTQKEGGVNNE